MLFNSQVFIWFCLAFFLLHLLVRDSLVRRNSLILAGSYLFYGWWDWRFLGLLFGSSIVDYWVALRLEGASEYKKKLLVGVSLTANLGTLGFFKYFDFFIQSAQECLNMIGLHTEVRTLGIILPVGISFYTFQSLSYTLDVYRGKIRATRNVTAFLAYVSFFPQLVAGPIERATHLLPQFLSQRTITRAAMEKGIWLVVWGFFKKVVLADNLGHLVDMVYGNPSGIEGPVIALATIAFGFQIYCDFSGYSDIARGLALMLGFDLMLNFNLPYFAVSPQDFWRRWHISLSTWFRDYLYIPLGGNRKGTRRTILNLFITMVIAGLWHGAGWNFVLWGAWHGLALGAFAWVCKDGKVPALPGWFLTMAIVFFGWMLFRAASMQQILLLCRNLASLNHPTWLGGYLLNLCVFSFPLITMQIWQFVGKKQCPSLDLPTWVKALLQAFLVYWVALFWDAAGTPFIYFQF